MASIKHIVIPYRPKETLSYIQKGSIHNKTKSCKNHPMEFASKKRCRCMVLPLSSKTKDVTSDS
ncbi:hypothetical protein [Nitrosopumilus sp.]|uniref:hypothetical protein n=1 Tax=Nitrosopumilus sp. TaxID=2024843 RepID=UPI00292F2E09|nr:hypothetical protein [Nitrosopumilus sp.]